MDHPTQLALLFSFIISLIYLSSWFSGTETALTHLNPVQIANMEKRGVKNVAYVLKLRKKMNRTIIAILIGNNIVNVTLSAVVAIVADAFFNTLGISIVMGIITFLIIMFGEITPKSRAIRDCVKMASKRAKILYFFMKSINPLISLFMILTKAVLRVAGIKQQRKEILVTEENIADLASLGHKEGVLKLVEKDIIHKVFAFGEKKVKDIMIPIKKVLTVNQDCTFIRAKEILSLSKYTRIPVINENKRIIGIIYSKDLLNKFRGSIKKFMRKPLFFNIGTHVTSAFAEMRKRRVHIAVIRDNNSRHIGIITMEDIIEELVGEIEDEYFKNSISLDFK